MNHPDDPSAAVDSCWTHADPADRERFVRNVFVGETCWIWTGGLEPYGGYGRFRTANGVIAVHRWSHQATTGTTADVVRHGCDIRCCVRPDHLIGGSQADNLADLSRRGPRRGWAVDAPRRWPELAYAIRDAARNGDHRRVTELLEHPEQLTLFG